MDSSQFEISKDIPEDCLTRTLQGTAFSFVFGSFLGAIHSNWKDMPYVVSSRFESALKKTGGSMMKYGVYLGSVGLLYSATHCVSEKFRQKEDYMNGFYGGLSAGLAVGVKTKSVGVGVGTGIAMGTMSALVDATGHSIIGQTLVSDDRGLPSRKKFSPTVRIE